MHILNLPDDYSLGRILFDPRGEGEVPRVVEAQGTVRVPEGVGLHLEASQEVCDDLKRISTAPPELFTQGLILRERNLAGSNFHELRSLKLSCLIINSCNFIGVQQLRDLGELKSLQHLNLSQTPLEAPDFSWIPRLSDLRTLLLPGMGVEDSSVPFLTSLALLEDLDLAHSRVSDLAVQRVWGMAALKRLNLAACPIGDEAVRGVGQCPALVSLGLSETRISDYGIEAIATEFLRNHRQLRSLQVRSCDITDGALVRLASLNGLRILDLFGTKVTFEGVAFLKRVLPACRIAVGRAQGGGPEMWQVAERNED